MNKEIMETARLLREYVLDRPGHQFGSPQLRERFGGLSRPTALRLLRLLVIAGLLEESGRNHRTRMFTATEKTELPPIAELIEVLQANKDEHGPGVLKPEVLAAVYGYPEEAAREALAAVFPSISKAPKPTAKPKAATGEPTLVRHGVCAHSLGWGHRAPGKKLLVISGDGFGPFALPCDSTDVSQASRLGDKPTDGVRGWSWEELRRLVPMARNRKLDNRPPGVPVTLPLRRPARPVVSVWVTARLPPDPANARPNAVGWLLIWHGIPDSADVRRGGTLLLDVDPDAADTKIALAVLDAEGGIEQPIKGDKVIEVDKLLAPEARSRAARAAYDGKLATITELVVRAYKDGGLRPTHRIVD